LKVTILGMTEDLGMQKLMEKGYKLPVVRMTDFEGTPVDVHCLFESLLNIDFPIRPGEEQFLPRIRIGHEAGVWTPDRGIPNSNDDSSPFLDGDPFSLIVHVSHES